MLMIALRLTLIVLPLLGAAWAVVDELYRTGDFNFSLHVVPDLVFDAIMAITLTMVVEVVLVLFAILIVSVARGVAFGDIGNLLITSVTQIGQPSAPPPAAYGTTTQPANEHVRERKE